MSGETGHLYASAKSEQERHSPGSFATPVRGIGWSQGLIVGGRQAAAAQLRLARSGAALVPTAATKLGGLMRALVLGTLFFVSTTSHHNA